MQSPIRRVTFRNFKGFRRFSLLLNDINVLVGSNNAGKSTIISAFRILELGVRKARSRKPERIVFNEQVISGYQIDLEDLDVSSENVHTDYEDVDSLIEFTFEGSDTLSLHFPKAGNCFMTAEARGALVASPTTFNRAFPLPMVVVPVLAPLEHDEEFVKPATVQRNLGTSRASRNFRTYWTYYPDGFARFAELIESTWHGMEIRKPEEHEKIVRMYCLERRMTRELYWAGFGFQIWCQLIAHISRAEGGSLIVMDEPEVYLHPDVQRQILPLLDRLGLSVLMATHSTEIIAQAEPYEIVTIDKRQTSARRLREFDEVQLVLEEIGSVQNLSLSRLARYGRVIFFEGQDVRMLQKLGAKAGVALGDLSMSASVIEAGGFQAWTRIRDFLWGAKRLGLSLHVAAVFDRDYFPDSLIGKVKEDLTNEGCTTHIHARKELENYLLDAGAILSALRRQSKKDAAQALPDIAEIDLFLEQACEEFREQVFTQCFAKKLEGPAVRDNIATRLQTERAKFEMSWQSVEWRLAHVPGKDVLKSVKKRIQDIYKVSINNTAICDGIRKDAMPRDLLELFATLEAFLAVVR